MRRLRNSAAFPKRRVRPGGGAGSEAPLCATNGESTVEKSVEKLGGQELEGVEKEVNEAKYEEEEPEKDGGGSNGGEVHRDSKLDPLRELHVSVFTSDGLGGDETCEVVVSWELRSCSPV